MLSKYLAVVLLSLIASVANAACPASPRLVCAEYFNSSLVAEAKLISIRHIVPKSGQDGYVYTMELITALRGEIAARFEIYEENSSGRASFEWRRAESYLLFLYPVEHSNRWSINGCGNSGALARSGKTLKVIESLRTGPDVGVIHGKILSAGGSTEDLEGISIEVRGEDRVFRVQSDRNGEFEIKVPVGEYKARAFRKGWKIRMDALTFENPVNLKLERGGCAQVQFYAEQVEFGTLK